MCDITYVRMRKVVGWAMASSMPAQLVCSALSIAIASRCPPAGLVVHSDRGSQYASAERSALLARHGLIGSMSRKGNCWDNAVIERFFLNLKMERVWQRDYANHAQAQADISDYRFTTAPGCTRRWGTARQKNTSKSTWQNHEFVNSSIAIFEKT